MKAIALLSLLFISTSAWAQDPQVTASIDSDTVGVQDQFQFTITVSGSNSGDAENPRLPNLKAFQIVAGPSTSTQFQWINGRSSSSKSFTYILIPEKEGQFTIDPVEVKIGGKSYRTRPLQVRVTSASRGPAPRQQRSMDPFDPFEGDRLNREPAGDAVFIKAVLDRSTAYPGQQVTLSYQLYTQVGITGIQLQENPSLSGFWIEDIEIEKNLQGTLKVVNGREYQMFTIKKQALFATTTGMLKIPASIFAVSARSEEDFFGVFGRTQTLYRKTPELQLEVKPLPLSGRPPDFTNAVGSYKLTSGIDKDQVAAGDAVAFRVKLEGQGNLKMIPDIQFPSIPDFTIYSSKRADAIRPSDGSRIEGNKTWEYVLVPKAPGRYTIPGLSFSYFDAELGKYETAKTAALSLNVTRGSDATTFTGLSGNDKQDVIRRGTDIHFIKPLTGGFTHTDRPDFYPLWFYLIGAVMLAANIGMFLYQKRHASFFENPVLLRRRRAKRTALKQLSVAIKEGQTDSRRFYDRAATALSGYLTDKFHLSEIELTGDNLERMLANYAVTPETVEETRHCLQECDFGRFVSASDSSGKRMDLSARIRKNIDTLETSTVTADVHKFSKARFER